MITKGEIIRLPLFGNNKFLVRIPIFESAGMPEDSTLGGNIMEATLCYQPGNFNGYRVGDKVFISFENNEMAHPIILGKLYTDNKEEFTNYSKGSALEITDYAKLPLTTQFGDEITAEDILAHIRQIANLEAGQSNLISLLTPTLIGSTISSSNKFEFTTQTSFNNGIGIFSFGNTFTFINLYGLQEGTTYKMPGSFVYDSSGSVVTTTINIKYESVNNGKKLSIWSGGSHQMQNGYTGYLYYIRLF